MLYLIIRGKYLRHEITAAQVWEYADAGKITLQQAFAICGPRPKGNGGEEDDGGEG